MILGVDTGNRTFGWARFDHARKRFDGIGAHELKPMYGVQKTDDQGDRAITIGGVLLGRMRDVDLVVVERMSFPPGGTVPIALGFAITVGVARALGKPIYTVKPQDWQRAVQPEATKKVDYKQLAVTVGEFVKRDPESARALSALDPALITHAIDAGAIAIMGAYRLGECRRVKERDVA